MGSISEELIDSLKDRIADMRGKLSSLTNEQLAKAARQAREALERREVPVAMPNNKWDNLGENVKGYPSCPHCFTNYDVYCMEEEVHCVNCQCRSDEYYCFQCGFDFKWTLKEDNIDNLIEDMDEILDIQVLADHDWKGGCGNCGEIQPHHCTLGGVVIEWDGENYAGVSKRACPNCGDPKEHECKTPDGLIVAWAGDGETAVIADHNAEIKCHCTPQKMYICAVCGVERDTQDSAWEHRVYSSDGVARTTATIAEAIVKVNDIITGRETPYCRCEPEQKYFCGKCRVTRSTPQSDWHEVDGYQAALEAYRKEKGVTSKVTHPATKSTPVPYSNPATRPKYPNNSWEYSSDWYGWGGKCRHYGEEVELPDKTIIQCSSLWDDRKDPKDYPDRGLYFDWLWKPDWRSELSLWPDYQEPTNLVATAQAIVEHFNYAKAGQRIELGCIGGHGRTGTALACMVVLAGLPASEAGTWVKKNYCFEAIESQVQFWYIKWFEAWSKGQPLPEKPVYKSKTTGFTTTQFCTRSQHYVQWMANPNSKQCTIKKAACNQFEADIEAFAKGNVDAFVIKAALEITGDTKFLNIDGYMIPKSQPGGVSHNRSNAGCKCDYCRYTSRGMGALLDEWPVTSVFIKTPSGVVETSVTPEFQPKPPHQHGQHEGERIGDYEWITHGDKQVWAWDAIKKAKARYVRENTERNQKAKATAKAIVADVNKEGTAPPGVHITGQGSLDLKDVRKVNSMDDLIGEVRESKRSNRRNKKNPNRNGGRRRNNKHRR